MIINLLEAPAALAQVAQWQFTEWGWMYPGQTFHDRLAQLQLHFANDPLPSTYVAFHGDFLAGTVSLVANDMEEHPALTPWLASLYVTRQYRDKGIGAQLVKHAERVAYDLGYDSLFLYTEHAVDYFLERDWEPIHNMQRNGGQVMIMERELTESGSAADASVETPPDDAPSEPTD